MRVYYHTAEHYFQINRLPKNHPHINELLQIKSPMGLKMAVKKFKDDFIIEPMSNNDIYNMMETITLKLDTNPELVNMLRETGDLSIYEDVTSRPHGNNLFWGATVPDFIGKNVLGIIWMQIRNNL